MGLGDPTEKTSSWTHGAVPLARNETHDRVVDMLEKEARGKVLDVPTGTGVLAGRLKKMGHEVSCCDINSSYFSIPDLSIDLGDLNRTLPYPDNAFDYITCLDGIEHTENPFNAIREFRRILKARGKLILSIPNFLNIERRVRYLLTGGLSKIPSHETIQQVWKNDLSMAHLSPLGYPLLKFVMEHYGFRIVRLEKDRPKPKMIWLWPLALLIRLSAAAASKRRREAYRLDETLSGDILMGGNTLIIVAERTV
ncbi:MAG: class I SAM-dependent methyltransferase [Deltaproteobacteria bacterium]|nr:MAG: class I SAM-dependent methyltransferase [Deltaproteobacteria bacterium]